MNISVTVDTREATAMLDRLAEPLDVRAALERAAMQGAQMISGVPHGATGQLAGTIEGRTYRHVALITSGAPYARFVFGGTRHMAARPPSVPADAIRQILADELLGLIEGK